MSGSRHAAALVVYRVVSDAVGKGATFFITILAARRLSQEAFGVFSLGSTVGWMSAVATDAGMQQHLARRVAQRPGEADHLLAVWLGVRQRAAIAGFVVVAIALAVTQIAGARVLPLLLLVLVYILSGLVEFIFYLYRGLSRSDLESTSTLYWRVAMLGLAVPALLWRPGVTTLAAAMLLPVVGTLAVSVRAARRLAQAAAESHQPRAIEPDPDVGAEFRRDVLPIGGGVLLSALYFRIDILLIELWKGTGAVALYNAVFRLVEALRLLPAAVMAVALPSLSRATDARLLLQLSVMVTGCAVVIAAVLWSAAGWLVPLVYGVTYAEAVPAFRILLLSFPLMSLNYALTQQLIGWNGHRPYAVICAAALLFNVSLNAWLIPALSTNGAAWATLWTEVVLTLGCTTALRAVRSRQRAQAHAVTVVP